jgi:hypothetical protein
MSALFADNPLRSRADLQAAVRNLFLPVKAHFSPGAARVKLGYTGARYPDYIAEIEGFARPLWGLVPLAAGGGGFSDWQLYRRGLANGSDPQHSEYWGAVGKDQAVVEMTAIGFALALIPEHVWEPLDSRDKTNLGQWLRQINKIKLPENNWLFFRVLVNLGLMRVGAEYDAAAMQADLSRLDAFYLGDGWYSDGLTKQRDYYVAFAMHFYGLVYAKLAAHDSERVQMLRQRAAVFAPDFMHWFAADGAALPFGRSLTYRFAQGALWGALAFADVEALPWGVVKGLALRHLRWWAQQPIAYHDGILSIGYAYPNLNMSEAYNAPGSPYWALKFFLPLALPETHPFWQADEFPLPVLPLTHVQPHAGMIVCRDATSSHVFALSSGQQHEPQMRHSAEKYTKFAYSTVFGFSVPSSRDGLIQGAYDSMLTLTDDGTHYRVREALLEAVLEGDVLRSRWQPWPDVEVETWLLPRLPWHVRVHRLRTKRPLQSAEGGFALARPDTSLRSENTMLQKGDGFAIATYSTGWSGIRDLRGDRQGTVVRTDPNTNLLHPRTVLPTLVSKHNVGEHWLVCAVLGLPGEGAWQDIWSKPPSIPDTPVELQGQRTVIYNITRLRRGLRAQKWLRSLLLK